VPAFQSARRSLCTLWHLRLQLMRSFVRQTYMTVRKAIRRANRVLPGVPAPEGERDERWQRIIEVGHYIRTDPEAVWEFVDRWGGHEDADLRSAIATCLLEHLLEHHFVAIFPRVEARSNGDRRFAATFTQCWKLGQSLELGNVARFDALMARHSSHPAA
jgi:hypothetical protein